MAFLNERYELQKTFDDLRTQGTIPEGFQRLIDTHFEQAPAGQNEVLLNTNHRLVARRSSRRPCSPLASVLRLLVNNALSTAGATLPRDVQRQQVDDLDWIAEALWGATSPDEKVHAMAADSDDREAELDDLEQKHDSFSDACQMRSALRVAQEIARIAKQEQLVVPYLNARFKMMNKARSVLDPDLGCEIAVELVSFLESEDRARLIQPDLPQDEYAQTVAWMSSCAYDNLAVHTANRQGYNSPGMQACISSGLEICRRTGKLQCIACFREYATEVYRAADDLDMALHSARLVSGQPDDSPGTLSALERRRRRSRTVADERADRAGAGGVSSKSGFGSRLSQSQRRRTGFGGLLLEID